MSSSVSILTILLMTFTLTLTSPIPFSPPDRSTLGTALLSERDIAKRTPVSTSAFQQLDDFPVNVVFLGGSNQYGGWIPVDGSWYSLDDILCIDEPGSSTGACSIPTVDDIGVATGDGPCSFVGVNGFSATVSGAAGSGWYSVGPPQQIIMAACG